MTGNKNHLILMVDKYDTLIEEEKKSVRVICGILTFNILCLILTYGSMLSPDQKIYIISSFFNNINHGLIGFNSFRLIAALIEKTKHEEFREEILFQLRHLTEEQEKKEGVSL